MTCSCCRSRWVAFLIFVIGAVLLVIGCSVEWVIFPKVLENQIDTNLELKEENTDTWEAFIEPPVPVYMNFYFFNVENPVDVRRDGAKPRVAEYGPYAYHEVRRKENVTHGGANSIYYNTYYSYMFDQERSNELNCYNNKSEPCSDQDTIIILNPIIAMLGSLWPKIDSLCDIISDIIPDDIPIVNYCPFIVAVIQTMVVNDINAKLQHNGTQELKDDLFFESTVDGILYQGSETWILSSYFWENFIQNLVKKINDVPIGNLPELDADEINALVHDYINKNLPQLSDGKFGIFKGRNDTSENSMYRLDDGENEQTRYLSIIEFNGETSLPSDWWPDIAPTPKGQQLGVKGICHDIKGTDGTQFPPGIKTDQRLWMFVSDLCRSIWVDFDEEVEVQGIEAYRFRPGVDVFDMSMPDNFCYCPTFTECGCPEEVNGTCVADHWNNTPCKTSPHDCYDGMMHVDSCFGGAPIIMSAPHFYLGDPELVNAMDGLKPNKDLHDTILDLEPITGINLNAHKRIQINMPLKKIDTDPILILSGLIDDFAAFPILWADENAELDEENADELKRQVIKPIKLVDGFSIALGLVLGSILILSAWAMILFCTPRDH